MKEVKMRRYQNLLTVSGLGVIMFGVWSVLRTILLLFFQQNAVSQAFNDESVTVRILSYTILAVMLLADSLSRLFVGLSARAEGFGKKKGYAYIVFAVKPHCSGLHRYTFLSDVGKADFSFYL